MLLSVELPEALPVAPSGTQLSPMGIIPKSSQPGKWWLIIHLSSPNGVSVNDGIEADLCSLEYLRLDKVIGVWYNRHLSTYNEGAPPSERSGRTKGMPLPL